MLPEYSREALRAGLQGTVRVGILIGTDGHVSNAWLIDGHPLLYLSAYQAVRQRVYEPLRVANDPVEAYHRLEIQFRLPTTRRSHWGSATTPSWIMEQSPGKQIGKVPPST